MLHIILNKNSWSKPLLQVKYKFIGQFILLSKYCLIFGLNFQNKICGDCNNVIPHHLWLLQTFGKLF